MVITIKTNTFLTQRTVKRTLDTRGKPMKLPKRKTITELRKSLFETFDEVLAGESQVITHKNGSMVAMVPIETLEKLQQEIELHKNLAIGYAQAMRPKEYQQLT